MDAPNTSRARITHIHRARVWLKVYRSRSGGRGDGLNISISTVSSTSLLAPIPRPEFAGLEQSIFVNDQ